MAPEPSIFLPERESEVSAGADTLGKRPGYFYPVLPVTSAPVATKNQLNGIIASVLKLNRLLTMSKENNTKNVTTKDSTF